MRIFSFAIFARKRVSTPISSCPAIAWVPAPSVAAARTMRAVRARLAFMVVSWVGKRRRGETPAQGKKKDEVLLRDADALVGGGQEARGGVDLARGEHRRVRQLAAALRAADLLVRRGQEAAGHV